MPLFYYNVVLNTRPGNNPFAIKFKKNIRVTGARLSHDDADLNNNTFMHILYGE